MSWRTNDQQDWDVYFLEAAKHVATKSKDKSVQVGAVIVGPDHEIRSTGFNGFCRGIEEIDVPERWERPEKYKWVEHAERNAIYNAARVGVSTVGCTMYLESPPCTECARAVIQAGIQVLVYYEDNPFSKRDDWKESIQFALDMMIEAGVDVVVV